MAFELKFGASVNHRGRLQAHNSLHAESIEETKNKREATERTKHSMGGRDDLDERAMIKVNNETFTKSSQKSKVGS